MFGFSKNALLSWVERVEPLDVRSFAVLMALPASALLFFLGASTILDAVDVFRSPDGNAHVQHQTLNGVMFIALAVSMAALAVSNQKHQRLLGQEKRSATEVKERVSIQMSAMNAHAVICEMDVNGRVMCVNKNFEKLFGYRRSEILGLNAHILYEDGVHDDVFKELLERVAQGEVFTGEQRLLTKTGQLLTTACTAVPHFDRDGRHVRTISICTDMTDVRRAEANKLLTAMLKELQDEVYMYDLESLQIFYMNDLALSRCDWTLTEAREKKISDTSAIFNLEAFREHVRPLLRGEAKTVRVFAKHEKGYVEISTRIQVQTDNVPVFVSVLRDVTEQKMQEKRRLETVANVSHELRSPLTSIKGSLRLLQAGLAGMLSEDGRRLVDIADRNTDRMLEVLDDILDFEKLMAGKMEMNFEPIQLAHFVEEAVEMNQGYATEHGVRFVAAVESSQAWASGDKSRLMQVMTNLMSNAAKYSPEGAEVRLTVSDIGNAWRISVADEGPGIPETAREKVFESFGQIEAADGKARKGTGLGLAVCRKIIVAHAGKIDFESVVGEGSTFYFDLAKADVDSEPEGHQRQIAAE